MSRTLEGELSLLVVAAVGSGLHPVRLLDQKLDAPLLVFAELETTG